MKIDAALVERTARLASLELAPGEAEEVAGQLTRLVEHFDELRSIPASELSAGEPPAPTPLRADSPEPFRAPGRPDPAGGAPSFAEGNAPEFSHGHFVVPRIVHRPE